MEGYGDFGMNDSRIIRKKKQFGSKNSNQWNTFGNQSGWGSTENQGSDWNNNNNNQGGWGGQGGQGWGQGNLNQGWGNSQNQGWGNQGQGWQNQNQGWGNQQHQGWGHQQNQALGNQQRMGFFSGQSQWGNNLQGSAWITQQIKRQHFNFINPNTQLNLNQIIEDQILFIQPSPSHIKLEQLKQTGKAFEDQRFPPSVDSLYGQDGPQSSWSSIKWQKVTSTLKGAQIFTDKVEPSDILQGALGDCYFLAALAALSQRPDRIFNLFLFNQINQQKYFSVKMLYKGKWLTIDMDQWIPFKNGKPAFTSAKDNQLWVILLEKAWAKMYSNYKRIEAGYPQQALHDLTGAPIKQIYFQNQTFDKERQWEYLLMASQKEYSMVASSQAGSDTNKSVKGVVQGHAYTILNATYLSFQGNKVRLIQMRNPWGKTQSTTRWSDSDPNWNYVDPNQKQRLKFNPNVDDGIFFMSYDDFIKQFRALTIAEINDHASYVYLSTKDPQCKGVFFKVQIQKNGYYSLHIDKTPQRSFPNNKQDSYRYPKATLTVGKLMGSNIQKLQGFSSSKRTLFKGYQLEPGIYIVKAQIDYDSNWEKDYDVNLAVYGEYACKISFANHNQAASLVGNPNVDWTGQVTKNSGDWNDLGNQQWGNQGNNNQGWGNNNQGNQGWGNNNQGNQGWGNNNQGNQGWGNNNQGNQGWENNNQGNQGWGNNPGSNQQGWGQDNNQGWGNQNQGWGNKHNDGW